MNTLSARDFSIMTLAGTSFAGDGVPIRYSLLSANIGVLSGAFYSGQSSLMLSTRFFHNGYSESLNTCTGQIWLIPEPGTAWLVAGGLLALGARRRSTRLAAQPPVGIGRIGTARKLNASNG
jgi:hypothetical protein